MEPNPPIRVSVVGGSGYSGAELIRLLAPMPRFELAAVFSDRWAGRSLADAMRLGGPTGRLVVGPQSDAAPGSVGCEVALLATPAEVSADLAPKLLASGVRVIDLSGAFRLARADYPRWYHFEHPCPELLDEACFGLLEVAGAAGSAPPVREARLVANPGCYATAAIVAIAPLVRAKLIDESAVFVDGKSGVTGAGRKLEERFLFAEVDENVSPYRVADHQHAPEMERILSRVADAEVRVTFTPHLLPVRRGLLVTAYASLRSGVTEADVERAFRDAYAGAALVDVERPDAVTIASAALTPRVVVGATADVDRRTVVALAALDNLLKGAASQAVQNLCAMVGAPPPFLEEARS